MTAPDGMRCGRVKDAAPYGGGTKKAAVRHPRWGGDGGLAALQRDCAICGWRFGTIREDFARCDGRPEALPLVSAIFEKTSKTFIFLIEL